MQTPLKSKSHHSNPSRFPLCGFHPFSHLKALNLTTPLLSTTTPSSSSKTSSTTFSSLLMATSLSAALPSSLHASCTTSLAGDDRGALVVSVVAPARGRHVRAIRSRPRMGNVNEGKGLFAPIVVVARNLVGRKRFNQLRGKAIALHSQVITEFCKTIGADSKQRQGLIRLAKKNGEKLGFLA